MTDIKIYSDKFHTMSQADFMAKLDALQYQGQKPMSEEHILFLDSLSKKFMRSHLSRLYPQITTLGFWLRKAAVTKMVTPFNERQPDGIVLTSRGIAFHLPPANVDTLFVYSWALSYLSGNANIVRLPANLSEVTQFLIDAVIETLNEFDDLDRNLFVSYDYTTDWNALISRHADLRMIWGGDEKVLKVSVDPVRPDGLSLGFPDRYSYSLINEQSYVNANEEEQNKLAENFYNDLFWFDQMGCGSPKILYWYGQDVAQRSDFLLRVSDVSLRKGYEAEASTIMQKFVYMNDILAENIGAKGSHFSKNLHIIELDEIRNYRDYSQGGGMLFVAHVGSMSDIAKQADKKDQTITHFGFEKEQLHSLATALIGRGGYRIVPIGEALNFGPIWDGLDLLTDMTRKIVVSL